MALFRKYLVPDMQHRKSVRTVILTVLHVVFVVTAICCGYVSYGVDLHNQLTLGISLLF